MLLLLKNHTGNLISKGLYAVHKVNMLIPKVARIEMYYSGGIKFLLLVMVISLQLLLLLPNRC